MGLPERHGNAGQREGVTLAACPPSRRFLAGGLSGVHALNSTRSSLATISLQSGHLLGPGDRLGPELDGLVCFLLPPPSPAPETLCECD